MLMPTGFAGQGTHPEYEDAHTDVLIVLDDAPGAFRLLRVELQLDSLQHLASLDSAAVWW